MAKILVDQLSARKMQPKVRDWKPLCEDTVKFAQVKKNGYNLILVVDKHGRRHALCKKRDFYPKLREHQKLGGRIQRLPKSTILFCEVYVKGGRSSEVVTAINKKNLALDIAPFAMPVRSGVDMRSFDLLEIMGFVEAMGFEPPETEEISPFEDDLKRFYIERAEEHKEDGKAIEGYVLKEKHCEGWWRIKPTHDIDVVITGWKEGNGKFLGLVGALLCSVYDKDGDLVEISSASGMTEDVRYEITDLADAGELINRVVELKYQSVEANGRLQFPRFQRFRDDKEPKECTMEQLA